MAKNVSVLCLKAYHYFSKPRDFGEGEFSPIQTYEKERDNSDQKMLNKLFSIKGNLLLFF